MSPVEHPKSKRLMFLVSVPWILGLAAATQTWGAVDNFLDHDWVLAGGNAVSTLATVALIILFLWLRRRAGRNTKEHHVGRAL